MMFVSTVIYVMQWHESVPLLWMSYLTPVYPFHTLSHYRRKNPSPVPIIIQWTTKHTQILYFTHSPPFISKIPYSELVRHYHLPARTTSGRLIISQNKGRLEQRNQSMSKLPYSLSYHQIPRSRLLKRSPIPKSSPSSLQNARKRADLSLHVPALHMKLWSPASVRVSGACRWNDGRCHELSASRFPTVAVLRLGNASEREDLFGNDLEWHLDDE